MGCSCHHRKNPFTFFLRVLGQYSLPNRLVVVKIAAFLYEVDIDYRTLKMKIVPLKNSPIEKNYGIFLGGSLLNTLLYLNGMNNRQANVFRVVGSVFYALITRIFRFVNNHKLSATFQIFVCDPKSSMPTLRRLMFNRLKWSWF